MHSKQAQAPLHSDLLATPSRRNKRPYVIAPRHRSVLDRTCPADTLSTAQSEKAATLRANQAGTRLLFGDSGFAVNKSGGHLPFLMKAKGGHGHLIVLRNGFGWLVRKLCAVCNKVLTITVVSDSAFLIPNQCRKTANLRCHEQKAVSYFRDFRQHPHFFRAGRRCTQMSSTVIFYPPPRPLEMNQTSLRCPQQRIVLALSLTGSGRAVLSM